MYNEKASTLFDERTLQGLRSDVEKVLSHRRMAHTLGVEEMASRLSRLCLPAEEPLLRAAALLHDVTKEADEETQRALLQKEKRRLRRDERDNPKIWHAVTACALIKEKYPDLAVPALLHAVRWHTTAHAGLTVREAILYLADYIEEGRTYPDCVELRKFFFDAQPEKMTRNERRAHLFLTVEKALAMTLADLKETGKQPVRETISAYEWLCRRSTDKRRETMVETLENWAELPALTNADAKDTANAAAKVLDLKKAADVVVIPVEGHSDITDYLILATATSAPHVQSLADELVFRMGERGVQTLHTDGGNRRSWVVVDFGNVMVHIFDRETRGFYHLDKLYKDAAGSGEKEQI